MLFPLLGIESRSLGRPVRSQTLYCLSYSGSYEGLVHSTYIKIACSILLENILG